MGPMELETKPQVDRLRCWRERSVAAGTAPNSDPPWSTKFRSNCKSRWPTDCA